ncbi:MAG: TetR/AcrR family transcriptional regulator [Kofleriaceae bacterium]
MPPRASPLSAEARRASIISATVPLLRKYGASVTTAQIAMAAGVAEGTLFRAFPDKSALIAAAIASACDPTPVERELAQIDPESGLRARLIAAVEILQRRVEGMWQLMSIMAMTSPAAGCAPPVRGEPSAADGVARAFTAIFEAHRGELRCEPSAAARLLRVVTFAGSHPRIAEPPTLTAAEIVAVVLDGIRTRDAELDEEDAC